MWRRRSKVTVAGLLLATIGLSGLGIAYLVNRYLVIVTEEGVVEEAGKMRNGVFALIDLDRLSSAMRPATPSEEEAKAILSEAVDLLFVRSDTFRRSLGERATPKALEVIEALDDVVARADALLTANAQPWTFAAALDGPILAARQSLMRYYDQQRYFHQVAMAEQEAMLRRMTLVAAALLGVFAIISCAAILLWRSELEARLRRRAAEEEARWLAYFDPLTGIYNRTRFQTECDRLLARHDQPILMLIDLDGFKHVNDTHGHAAGDALLTAVARRLRACAAPQGGAAARLGGDEFALCLPGPASAGVAATIARALIERLREPVEWEGTVLHPRCSVGIAYPAVLAPDDVPGPASLMRAADQALYRAKAAGKDAFCMFDPDMAEQENRRRRLRDSMPAALAAGDFIVEYQPQVWLSTGALHGFEALVRWRHEGITISPELFVPLAEESGFVAELDLWVLRHALREAMSWNLPDDTRTGISVNLSAQHFRDRAVIDHVRDCLEETGFPPALLTLEITEGVLIDDWEQATAVLAAFRAIGLHVALDDFGTGYSSMSYLRRLAVSEVKIDRSFLLDLEGSAQTRMVLDGLVDIVAALGMRLVVEGIENEAQARILRVFGAQIGQGYLFGRSVPGSTARTLAMGAGSGPLRQAG